MNRKVNNLLMVCERVCQRLTLKGKTIKWNNQVQINNRASWTERGLTMKIQDSTFEVNGTATGSEYAYNDIESSQYPTSLLKVGHKYFVCVRLLSGSVSNEGNNAYIVASSPYDETRSFSGNAYIFTCTASSYILVRINAVNCTYNNCKFAPYLIDLTEIGLANISSVDDFYRTALGYKIKNGLVLPFSATNQIIIVKTPFTFKGRNLINYKTEYDTQSFTLNGNVLENKRVDERVNDNFNLYIYDYDLHGDAFGKTITTNGRTSLTFTPTHSGEYRFYHSGSSINLVFLKCYLENGQTYTISFDVISHDSRVLGGLKLANIQLELGANATPYEPYLNDLVYTRTKRVDLGTLNWILEANTFFTCHELQNYIKKHTQYAQAPNSIRCGKYENSSALLIEGGSVNKKIGIGGDSYSIIIRDTDYTDATTFKNAMSGVILEYETAEPLELNGFDNDGYVDLGTLTWSKDGEHTFYSRTNLDMKVQSDGSKLSNIKCDRYVNNSFNNVDVLHQEGIALSISNEQPTIFITDNGYTDTTDFKNSLNGVILRYETNTPSVYDTFENHSGKVVRKIGKIKLNDAYIDYAGGLFRINIGIERWEKSDTPSKNIKVAEYKIIILSDLTSNDVCIVQSGNVIILKDTQYTSVSALKSAKGNVEIYYVLATSRNEIERSVLLDYRYNKVVDANNLIIDTERKH